MMYEPTSFENDPENRSSGVWRWLAAFLFVLNMGYLACCLLSTFRPDLWSDSDPFFSFGVLVVAIVSLQFMPFARVIWWGESHAAPTNIDEFERAKSQGVMTKAYRTMSISMMIVLLLLMVASEFANTRLNAVSAGYWMMWFTLMFFSLPTMYAAFDIKPAMNED